MNKKQDLIQLRTSTNVMAKVTTSGATVDAKLEATKAQWKMTYMRVTKEHRPPFCNTSRGTNAFVSNAISLLSTPRVSRFAYDEL